MHMKGFSRTFALTLLAVLAGMFFPLQALAQQLKVSGTVTDQNGETVIGATVKVKGGADAAATITDMDGHYTVNAPSDGTLVVSYIGFATQEVAVGGRQQVDIVMKEDDEMLEELVVVGYGTMKKKDLTGSVASLGSKDINNNSVNNIGSAIQGKNLRRADCRRRKAGRQCEHQDTRTRLHQQLRPSRGYRRSAYRPRPERHQHGRR